MGKKRTIKQIHAIYLKQYKKQKFVELELNGTQRGSTDQFNSLFLIKKKINWHEKACEFLVWQWFMEHGDQRWQNYANKIYQPNVIIPLDHVTFLEILHFISPQNIITTP